MKTRSKRHDLSEDPVIPAESATIDLHTHTARSDGLLEPGDLVAQAAAAGVRLLAITDHDTLAGVREVLAAGHLPAGLELLPGIELNAVVTDRPDLRESELHILGLGIDPANERLEDALALQRQRRRSRFALMVDRLRELGNPIDDALEALPATGDDDALGRPRIARAMIAKGYAVSIEDAFARFLSIGRPGYVPRAGLGSRECIELTHSAGGIASLAHFSEAPLRLDILDELIGYGLDGLEVYYRTFDGLTVAAMEEVAADRGLLATGGSDYHGDVGSYAESHAGLSVPAGVGERVRAALAR